MNTTFMVKPLVGAIALLSLATTVSENTITAAGAETIHYIHEKIKTASTAVGNVIDAEVPVATIGSSPTTFNVAFPNASSGLAESLASINLPGFGVFQTGQADFPQSSVSVPNHSDPDSSHAAPGHGAAVAGFVLVNSTGEAVGVQQAARTPIASPLQGLLPIIFEPRLVAYRPAISPDRPVVTKNVLQKICAGSDAAGPAASTKADLAGGECASVATAGPAMQTAMGHPQESQGAAGPPSSSPRFATTPETQGPGPLASSLHVLGDPTSIFTNAFGTALPNGESSARSEVGSTTMTVPALLATPVSSPSSLALLGLGLGCLSLALSGRKSA